MNRTNLYLLCILIGASVFFLSCDSREDKKSELKQKQEQWQRKVEEIRTTLTNRYNPIVFPSKEFARGKVFTYDLQNYLITDNGRPVLFNGTLDDITKDADHFTVHLSSHLTEYEIPGLELLDERRVRFHLECAYEDVKPLIENRLQSNDETYDDIFSWLYRLDEFSVVCRIKDVKKIVNYTVQGHPIGSEEVELEVETPDVFSVNGELVTMVKHPKPAEYRFD